MEFTAEDVKTARKAAQAAAKRAEAAVAKRKKNFKLVTRVVNGKRVKVKKYPAIQQ